MTSNLKEFVNAKLERYNFTLAVVASPDGQILLRCGDLEAHDDWLYRTLFGDAEAIANLAAYLKGQAQPRYHAQGKNRCILIMPDSSLIFGFFTKVGDPIAETAALFEKGNRIKGEIEGELPNLRI